MIFNKKKSIPNFLRSGFHDACGVGFIAESNGNPSKRVLNISFRALELMEHRGALLSDNNTGDGTGILTDIPSDLFDILQQESTGIKKKNKDLLGVGMVFTTNSELKLIKNLFLKYSKSLKLKYIGLRKVPVNKNVLGEIAYKTCPLIVQFFINGIDLKFSFEDRLYILRKLIENSLNEKNKKSFICSLSCETIVYKGLLVAHQLKHFYTDLTNPKYKCKVSVFHERFSTNTISTWKMTQPFRLLAHNGEINTIRGNRLWMKTREKTIKSSKWGEKLKDLLPILSKNSSDSFSLDNILEFLSKSGNGILKSIMMLIPEPYENLNSISKELRDFYIYNENFIEPWDGPAALVFTNGKKVIAKLDRNGLRPLRYSISNDGLVVMASEAGVAQLDAKEIKLHHHMSSGEIFVLNLDGKGIINNNKIKNKIATLEPYSKIIKSELIKIKRKSKKVEFGKFIIPNKDLNKKNQILFGIDREDISHFLNPMSNNGMEPLGSMGDDTPPAFLSKKSRRFYDNFKQAFAQVTNPPIDPIRERHIMSLNKYLGSEDNLLAKIPNFHGTILIESPILSLNDIQILIKNNPNFPNIKLNTHFNEQESIQTSIKRILIESEKAVKTGNRILFLSDKNSNEEKLPIPMLLITTAVHNYLIDRQIRSNVSIICITGDIIEDHHVACLTGFGADAVFPYLAYELIRENFKNYTEALSNYRKGLEKGLLKIMAKIGISTFSSYHGSMLFHGIGLGPKLHKKYFSNIICDIGNIEIKDLKEEILLRRKKIINNDLSIRVNGKYKYRKKGELHGYSPVEFKRIRLLGKNNTPNYKPDEAPIFLRDLLHYKKVKKKLKLNQIEKKRNIIRKFNVSAMSLGSLSEEAHRTVTKGAQIIGAHGNTGEGGEHYDRYNISSPNNIENSYIKQIASGRFGVSTEYLISAKEIQIKMAQGAKPGEGGQLSGEKVTLDIANVRMTTPGVSLISPPPHHDIYSIEDIAQLIFDLKQLNRRAKISVKLVSQPGIGLVACGVVKAGVDIILVSGSDGGTGSTPLGSMKHTGMPWEIGLTEVHQTLIQNKLRSQVVLRVDGGLKNGFDVIIASIFGAEEFDFGTSTLISIGCVMARQCHKNTCPVGIATQNPILRKKFSGTPENVSNYLYAIAKEVQVSLSELGFSQLSAITGRMDLLKIRHKFKNYVIENNIDLSKFVIGNAGKRLSLSTFNKIKIERLYSKQTLDEEIFEEIRSTVMTQGHAVIHKQINNTNRTVGGRLAGEITFLYGQQGFKGNIQCRFTGSAGQSFGAFLINNLELRLKGVANDYVGKSMSGGLITIRSPKIIRKKLRMHSLIGNVALYGATGGRLLVAGRVGERFAVRNSGAAAVVEGLGAHGCEYMTRGTIVILGKVGLNFGAGMTGGLAFIYSNYSKNLKNINKEYVRQENLQKPDFDLVWKMIRVHKFHTASPIASKILDNWKREKIFFKKVVPIAMDKLNYKKIYNEQINHQIDNLSKN